MIHWLKRAASSIANASPGKLRLWADSADSTFKVKDENGVIKVLGNGIKTIALQSTVGLNKTYRITRDDNTTFDFVVTDGRGIVSISAPATPGVAGALDTYTINYNDGTTSTFVVRNGTNGTNGTGTGTAVTPQAVGNTSSAGTAGAEYANPDHIHAHGNQTNAAHHAVATTGANGFMSSTDKTKLDGVATGATANAPATVAPPDVAAASAVGSATPYARQDHTHGHGNQLGGALHALSTVSTAGFQSAIDKARQDNFAKYEVNVLDFGADPTGATSSRTALTNAIAALPASGGIVNFPSGTYDLGGTAFALTKAHVTLRGASRYNTVLLTNSTTEDILQVAEFYCNVEDLTFRGPFTGTVEFPTKTAGVGVNATTGGAYTMVRRCSFQAMFIGIRLGNVLSCADDVEIRYFKSSGIVVDHNSDHQINLAIMDNNTGALPTGGGVRVLQAASLLMSNCNIIHSNFCLDIAPGAGITVPSVKGVNCFFDTSAVGLNMNTAGSFFRSEFTNCWFSSMSVAGIKLSPSTANGVDGITFVNCDIYNNVGGTTSGFLVDTGNVGKIKMVGCSIAGWTNGINIVAGATFFPTFIGNTIGAVAAFGVNGTGILVAAGTYKGLVISDNDVADNTTALNLGAVTTSVASYERITNNAGINPRGTELRPVATPALATLYTNTTGFRVHVHVKHGATANTGIILNGVTITATYVAAQIATYTLEPGGSIQFTGGTAPTVWSWVGL